jgi:hypothetical protein
MNRRKFCIAAIALVVLAILLAPYAWWRIVKWAIGAEPAASLAVTWAQTGSRGSAESACASSIGAEGFQEQW